MPTKPSVVFPVGGLFSNRIFRWLLFAVISCLVVWGWATEESRTFTRQAYLVTPKAAERWGRVTEQTPESKQSAGDYVVKTISDERASHAFVLQAEQDWRQRRGMKVTGPDVGMAAELMMGIYKLRKYQLQFTSTGKEAAARRTTRHPNEGYQITRLANPTALQSIGLRLEAIGNLYPTPDGANLDWYNLDGRPMSEPSDWNSSTWRDQYFAHRPLPQLCLVFGKTEGFPDGFQAASLNVYDKNTQQWLGTSATHHRLPAPTFPANKLLFVSEFSLLHRTSLNIVLDLVSGPEVRVTVPAEPGPLYDDGNGAVAALLKKGNIHPYMNWFHGDKWTALIHEPGTQHGSQYGLQFVTHPGRLPLGLETFKLELLANDRKRVIHPTAPHGNGDTFDSEGNRVLTLSKADADAVKFVRITHRTNLQRFIFPLAPPWLGPLPSSGDILDIRLPYARVRHPSFWDWYVSEIGQFEIQGKHPHWFPGDPNPKDFPTSFRGLTLREIWKRYAEAYYTNADTSFDRKRAVMNIRYKQIAPGITR